MKNTTTLVVMNYSSTTIAFYVIPPNLDTEQVFVWQKGYNEQHCKTFVI